MPTLASILKPKLADFGKELLAAGFRVYVYKSDANRVAIGGLESVATGLAFSRVVDGQECYASVSLTYFEAAEFSMPIKPSTQNGSSMWVGDARSLRTREHYGHEAEALTVENAKLYASPTNYNPLVGHQKNYRDPVWQDRLHVEVFA